MKRIAFVAAALAFVLIAGSAGSEVCNIKVVTDGNPDYTDIGSMIYSITSNWQTDKEKCWAFWYWNKIGRRQTSPMQIHGMELTDPIRQFNDYGFTMCSTVAGVNCSVWGAAGYKVKFWDITAHTVPEVFYDGAWHMYDSSLTALYTVCDGSRLAGVREIGAEGSCAASGGKVEIGHIAKYHCITSTSANGFLAGPDTQRPLAEEARCFTPKFLKYRDYTNNWDLGHRYILNLRDHEVYTKTCRKLGDTKEYYIPNPPPAGKDPESVNTRYRIRGNGVRTWTPTLTPNDIAGAVDRLAGMRAMDPAGLVPVAAGTPGEAVFRVEGSNVITSLTIKAGLLRRDAADAASIAISTNNGISWKEVFKADKPGETPAEVKLVDEVNGAYEVLVKVTLLGQADAAGARLQSISFETITMLNSKTQPRLRLGKNTVYVGVGEQTGSVVVWPEVEGGAYKQFIVDSKGVTSLDKHQGWTGVLRAAAGGEEGYVTFRLDTPGDMTRLTYGGRFYNRQAKGALKIFTSLDDGKTWVQGYQVPDTTTPFDLIHYEKLDAPKGHRSALVKYTILAENPSDTGGGNSIYAVRMEADYNVPDPTFRPLEVTYTWNEAQEDYSRVKRSHTQLVEKVPFTYEINVGGADHPVMESLRVNLKGAVPDVKYGYSDGEDAGGEKFVDRWVTWGKNIAEGKPYTCTVPSGTNWGAGDPDGKKLTDGVVGPPFAGGTSYSSSAIFSKGTNPVITVDLGAAQKCACFRIDLGGYDIWDALRGQIKDKCEVLVSNDDKDYKSVGNFNFNLRWKDIPANMPWPDEETMTEHNFELIPQAPVEARYVRFSVNAARLTTVSEVQVLDSVRYEPFSLKIALPDGKDRSDITQYNPKHEPTKRWRPGEPVTDGN